MADILFTAGQLTSKADELKQLADKFNKEVDNLTQTETTLCGMWDGEAKDAFNKAFTSDMTQLHNFYNAIMQYVNVLNNAIQDYANKERMNIEIANTRK